MKKSELRKLIREVIAEDMTTTTLDAVKEIQWVTPYYNSTPQSGFKNMTVIYNSGKQEIINRIDKFNKQFSTDFAPNTIFTSFKNKINQIAPNIKVGEWDFDVS